MSKINNANRPAMPFQEVTGMVGGVPTGYKNHIGLTKREQFAMAAMQSLIAVYWSDVEEYDSAHEMLKCLSQSAVEHADALLAELEESK